MRSLASVIIPVGPSHATLARQAAASALQQTAVRLGIEVIVAPDADADVPPMKGVTVLPAPGIRTGPAASRNRALDVATGWFAVFLDADDYLLPDAVQRLVHAYAERDAGYVYGDAFVIGADGVPQQRTTVGYHSERIWQFNLHPITALVPLDVVKSVGGFDADVDAWEDWTIWLRLRAAGCCGERIPSPTFVYRVAEGERMQRWYGTPEGLAAQQFVMKRYAPERIKAMGCSSCGGGNTRQVAKAAVAILGGPSDMAVQDGLTRVEFTGQQVGAIPYRLPNGTIVRLGNNASSRYADIPTQYLDYLQIRAPIRVVPAAAPFAPAPEPLPVEAPAPVAVAAEDAETETPSIPRRKGRTVKEADAE